MPKYGRFTFPDDAEVERHSGSDFLTDTTGRRRRLRAWDAAEGRWRLSKTGEAYYGRSGGEIVITIPVHYLIAKKDGSELNYRGYFPVSQLRPALKNRLQRPLGAQGAAGP